MRVAPLERRLGNLRVKIFRALPVVELFEHERQVPRRAGLVGLEREAFFIAVARDGKIAEFLADHAQIEKRRCRGGVESGGPRIGVGRAFQVPHLVMRHAQVEPVLVPAGHGGGEFPRVARGSRIVFIGESQRGKGLQGHAGTGPQFGQHGGIAAHGFAVAAIQEQRHQVRQSFLAARIPHQHLAVLLNGFAMPAELLQSYGAGEHGRFMIGKQREVLIERFLGLRGAAGSNQGNAQSEVRIHTGGIGGQSFAEGLGGRFPLLRVTQAHAQVVVCRAMARIQFRQRPVVGGCVFEVAQLEVHVPQRCV